MTKSDLGKLRVAPRAGAWIETTPSLARCFAGAWSHPVRVRGLKLQRAVQIAGIAKSHPVRVRGLKLA